MERNLPNKRKRSGMGNKGARREGNEDRKGEVKGTKEKVKMETGKGGWRGEGKEEGVTRIEWK